MKEERTFLRLNYWRMRANDCTLLVLLFSSSFAQHESLHLTDFSFFSLKVPPLSLHDLSIILLYILYFPSQFVIFLVSLIKNKNAFSSCTLSLFLFLSLSLSLSVLTIPPSKLLLLLLPAHERALGSLTADAYCSPPPWPLVCLSSYHTSLCSCPTFSLSCLCFSQSVN